jgi:hypothetical protein
MRARMSSWLAEYGDSPAHERYAYTLEFERPGALELEAPRAFALSADDAPSQHAPARATVVAKKVRLGDESFPLGVVDLGGAAVTPGLLVRCAASGLPLARLDGAHPRLNLAVARTNCRGTSTKTRPTPGEALFQAELVSQSAPKSAGSAALPELKRALERWGYVREK